MPIRIITNPKHVMYPTAKQIKSARQCLHMGDKIRDLEIPC